MGSGEAWIGMVETQDRFAKTATGELFGNSVGGIFSHQAGWVDSNRPAEFWVKSALLFVARVSLIQFRFQTVSRVGFKKWLRGSHWQNRTRST